MFTRGGDIKESLGIGSFAPVIGEIKKLLEEIIVERKNLWTFYSQYPIPEVKVVEWKSFPGKANNICKLVGLIETTSVGEFKEFLKEYIHNVKGVFSKRDFKMTCINFLSANKSYSHYEWEGNKNRVIMEIVYCRLSKN
ncbi:MAG TPA: hypothetical protein PK122_00250 [Candidatus Paceibacterota bacterium]|nr:hypothetical protein [Candidatus Paceibacterota bacterium]